MANVNFKLGFNMDRKGLNEAKKEISNIGKTLNENKLKIDTSEVERLKREVSVLDKALDKAFDHDTQKLNMNKLIQDLRKSNVSLSDLSRSLGEAGIVGSKAFQNLQREAIKTGAEVKKTKGFIAEMGETLVKTAKWSLASGAINTFQGSVQRAVGYVKGMDESLNNIRVVTGKSSQEMEVFAKQANDAAKALGKTTQEYSDASLLFFQQGKSAAEVKALTNATLVGANITGTEVSEMANLLTAVLNGYNFEANKAMEITDKLAAVGAATGSDFEELATGMSKVASMANVVGVNVDQLNAQLATITTVTREAPESIGTSLKTIYGRMTELKAGKEDEEGWTTGKVQETFKKAGLSILDQNNQLRDMGEVIEEVGGKWETFDRATQLALANAMAGQRQSNRLIALFQQWPMYMDALEESQNSSGAAIEQNVIRMDSLEYKTKQLRAELEQLWGSLLDEDILKGMTEGLTSIVSGVNNVIDAFGSMQNLLTTLGGVAVNVFSKQITGGVMGAVDKINSMMHGIGKPKQDANGMEGVERVALQEAERNNDQEQIELVKRRIQMRKDEEMVVRNLSAEKIKDYQATKNQILAEQDKLVVLKKQREEKEKAARQRIIDEGLYGEEGLAGSEEALKEARRNKEIEQKGLDSLLEQKKAILSIKQQEYSYSELEDIATSRRLDRSNKELMAIRKLTDTNRINLDNYIGIEDLTENISRVEREINEEIEERRNLLSDISQAEEDILTMRNEGRETEEEVNTQSRLEDLEAENGAIEAQAQKFEQVQTVIQGIGVAMQLVGVIKIFAGLGEEALTTSEKLNIIKTGLGGLSVVVISLIPMINMLEVSFAKAGMKAASAWMAALGPIMPVIAAVAALGIAVVGLYEKFNSVARATEKNKVVLEQMNKTIDESKTRMKELIGVQAQYNELVEGMSAGNGQFYSIGDLDTEQLEKYFAISNDIAAVAPELVDYYDEMGNAVLRLDNNLQGLIDSEKENIRLANEAKEANVKNFAIEYENTISELEAKIEAKRKILNGIEKNGSAGGYSAGDIGALSAEISGYQDQIKETQTLVAQNIIDPIFSASEAYSGLTKKSQQYARGLVDANMISQKMSNPEDLEKYTDTIGRFMTSFAEKNAEVSESIAKVEGELAKITEGGVSEAEMAQYEALKGKLEELNKTVIPLSESFDNLSKANQQNAISTSALIQKEVEDYDTLINKLSEYYAESSNMASGPMSAADLKTMGGMETSSSMIGQDQGTIDEIDAKLLELADKQGEIAQARNELLNQAGGYSREDLEAFNEQIREIETQEASLRESRKQAIDERVEGHVALVEEAMLQAELNELYDQQLNAMVETTEGYNQIAESVNELNGLLEGFGEVQSTLNETMTESEMDSYIESLSEYADQIPGLSEALDDYSVNGASAFDNVKKAAGKAFDEMEKQADKMYLALNKDSSSFYDKFLQDNKNMTNLAALEYGVRAENYKTYAEYEAALDKAKEKGKIVNLTETQKQQVLSLQEGQTAYYDYASGQLMVSNDLTDAQIQNANHTGQSTVSAYSQMRKAGVSVADSIRYAFAVLVDKISGGWANMVNSLIDALNSMLKAGGTWANKFIDLINKIPGMEVGHVSWGNIPHISGSNYASSVADSIADKYTEDDYNWNVDRENVTLKPPGSPSLSGGGGDSSSGGDQNISDGGGGGKDKENKEKEVEDMEWEKDIYYDINQQIERKSKLLDKLQTQQEELYGQDLIDNLEKQRNIMKEQEALLRKKIEMQKEDLKNQSALLKKQGVTFDKDSGQITNYNDIIQQKVNAANSLAGEAKQDAINSVKDFIESLDKYQSMVNETIWDTQKEIDDLVQSQREIFLEQFEVKVALKIEDNDKVIESLEFVKEFIKDTFENQDELYQNTLGQLEQQNMKIVDIYESLIDLQKESANLTGKQMKEKTEELVNELKDAVLEAKKLYEELEKIAQEALDKGLKMLDQHLERYQAINKEISHIENMFKLLGSGKDFELMDELYDQKNTVLEGEISALQAQKSALETALSEVKEGSEEWHKIASSLDKVNDKLNKNIEDIVKNLQAKLKNSIDSILDTLDKGLFDGLGLKEYEEQFKAIKDDRKEYLDTEEKITSIGKLQQKIQREMSSLNDPKQQDRLQKFMDSELSHLKSKDKLTKYDLERSELLYEIMLKQMALEEQKDAKQQMRLVRDTSGNWVYEYVTDTEAVGKAQEELSNLLEKLQQKDKDRLHKLQEDALKEKKEFEKKMKELAQQRLNGEIKSDEEFNQKMLEAKEEFLKKMGLLSSQMEEAQANATSSSLATIVDTIGKTEGPTGLVPEDQEKVIKDLAEAVGSDFGKLSGILNSFTTGNTEDFEKMAKEMGLDAEELRNALTSLTGQIKDDWNGSLGDMSIDMEDLANKVNESVNGMNNSWLDYQTKLEEILERNGSTMDDLKDKMTQVGLEIEDLNDKTVDLTEDFFYQLEQMKLNQEEAEKTRAKYEELKDMVLLLVEQIIAEYTAQQDANESMKKGQEESNSLNKKLGELGTGMDTAKGKATSLSGGFNGVSSSASSASSSVNSLKASINSLQSKTITITTVYETVYKTTGTPPSSGKEGDSKKDTNSKPSGGGGGGGGNYVMEAYATGGYTGSFDNPSEGKLAVLHEKELVLNKEDTKNILNAVKTARGGGAEGVNSTSFLMQRIANILIESNNKTLSSLNTIVNKMGSSKTPSYIPGDKDSIIEQTVEINADFSGVKTAGEIEKAFETLGIKASQYAMRKS